MVIVTDDSSSSASVERENVYDVENILDKKIIKGKTFYYVKWENFPPEQNTWEPLSNLSNVRHLVKKYEADLMQKNEIIKKSKFYLFNIVKTGKLFGISNSRLKNHENNKLIGKHSL